MSKAEIMDNVKNFFKNIAAWFKSHNIYDKKFYKKNGKVYSWVAKFVTSFVAVLVILVLSVVIVGNVYLSKINKLVIDEDTDLGISEEAEKLYTDSGIVNIMLYGVDSRDMSEEARSDAIMVLTIDRDNCKIKMTSIARDTYVNIPGYGYDKLNHAFVYGWHKTGNIVDGATLSMNTINSTFNLNTSDFVTANFWALAKIIDYVGGVEIDVDAAERRDLNNNYTSHIRAMGIDCPDIPTTGMQHLNGGQAVAYCRVRHVGGDVMRGARQREVLTAMFDKAKTMSASRYPGLISLVLSECSTTLTNAELIDLGMWAVANMGSITFDNLGLPTPDIDTNGRYINGVWYYTYDLTIAAQKIQAFILENNVAEGGTVIG